VTDLGKKDGTLVACINSKLGVCMPIVDLKKGCFGI
jgi:hypothetical protein